MRIVFFGTPLFAASSLNALFLEGEEIVTVITQPDKRKGRGRLLSMSPVKELAVSKGLSVLQPVNMRDKVFLDELSAIKPELMVVVAYGRILPESILNLSPLGCINVHASLLPKYRGAAPVSWAIINGEKTTGITTMLMDAGLDTGDILLQEGIEISDEDTTATLSKKLSELGALLLLKTIKGIKDGTLKPKPQTGDAIYAPIIRKEDGIIDWRKKAVEISNFVRGMYPWPCAYCHLSNERIKFIKVRAIDGTGKPGRIESVHKDNFIVGTGKGVISVLELQPEGKKIMSSGAFLQGRNVKEGAYFDET